MEEEHGSSQDGHAENAAFASLFESGEDSMLAIEFADAVRVGRVRLSIWLVTGRGRVTIEDVVRGYVDQEKGMLRRQGKGRQEVRDADVQLLHCGRVLSYSASANAYEEPDGPA